MLGPKMLFFRQSHIGTFLGVYENVPSNALLDIKMLYGEWLVLKRFQNVEMVVNWGIC